MRPIKAGDTGHTWPTEEVEPTKGLLRALLLPGKGNRVGEAPLDTPGKIDVGGGDEDDNIAVGTNENDCGAVAVKKGEDVRAFSKGEAAIARPADG